MALYTIVIGDQCLHAVGYAMGIQRDGSDDAVIATSATARPARRRQRVVHVLARLQRSVVFFCQNNQWAIASRSSAQTRIPLYRRRPASASPACGSTATTCWRCSR